MDFALTTKSQDKLLQQGTNITVKASFYVDGIEVPTRMPVEWNLKFQHKDFGYRIESADGLDQTEVEWGMSPSFVIQPQGYREGHMDYSS